MEHSNVVQLPRARRTKTKRPNARPWTNTLRQGRPLFQAGLEALRKMSPNKPATMVLAVLQFIVDNDLLLAAEPSHVSRVRAAYARVKAAAPGSAAHVKAQTRLYALLEQL